MRRFFTTRALCAATVLTAALMAAGLLAPATGAKPSKPPEPPPPALPAYAMTLLDVPNNCLSCDVTDMNNQGDIVGNAHCGVPDYSSYSYPVLWKALAEGGWAPLPLGDIVAGLLPSTEVWWELEGAEPPEFGRHTDGDTETFFEMNAVGINESGQICGHVKYFRVVPATETQPVLFIHRLYVPFRYTPSNEYHPYELLELASLPFAIEEPEWAYVEARGMNNEGYAICAITTASDPDVPKLVYLWRPGQPQIEPLPLTGVATAINDNGQITGGMNVNGETHAFIFDLNDGGLLDLGVLGGNASKSAGGYACAVNEDGQVVGSCWDLTKPSAPKLTRFLYTKETGMLDLWTLIKDPPAGATPGRMPDRPIPEPQPETPPGVHK